MAPAVSVIVITYNEELNLPRVLDSLAAQTYTGFEVLVIDSNSTDRTREVARAYAKKFSRFTVHRMRIRGLCRGRNTGARMAKGDLLVFMDSDISFAPDFLERTVAAMQRKRLEVAAVYMRADGGNAIDSIYYGILNAWIFLTQGFFPHAVGSCMVATKRAHTLLKGFDGTITLAEDNDYIHRARKLVRVGTTGTSVRCSPRRFAKEGRFRMGVKYVLVFLYRVFIGEIRTDVFKYRFGHYTAKK